MLSDEIVNRTLDKMTIQNRYSKGTVYFDKLSLVCYEIIYNDNEIIKFKIPESDEIISVNAILIDIAYKNNLLNLVQCVN